MYKTSQACVEGMHLYLNGHWPTNVKAKQLTALITYRGNYAKAKLHLWKDFFAELWKALNNLEKIKLMALLDSTLAEKKNSPDTHVIYRIKELKHILKQTYPSWKASLLQINLYKGLRYYHVPFNFNKNAEKPIEFDSPRFKFLNAKNLAPFASYAQIGSTFTTNRIRYATTSDNDTHRLLDAGYCAYVRNNNTHHIDPLIAVADGCGGHGDDKQQDKAIGTTAYVATKYAVMSLAIYQSPEQLKSQIYSIVNTLADSIHYFYPKNAEGISLYTEGTTLACGRAFREEKQYRFVGFNLGDSLLAAWHPATNSLKMLASAQVAISKQNQAGTAMLPLSYQRHEIQIIDEMLPLNSLLLAFTDGAYEQLPCKVIEKKYSDGTSYRETLLDEEKINKLLSDLPEKAAFSDVIQLLTRQTVAHIEQQRYALLQQVDQAKQAFTQKQLDFENELKQFQISLQPQWQVLATQEEKLKAQPYPDQKILQQTLLQQKQALVEQEKAFMQSHQVTLTALQMKTEIQLGDDFSLLGVSLLDTSSPPKSAEPTELKDGSGKLEMHESKLGK